MVRLRGSKNRSGNGERAQETGDVSEHAASSKLVLSLIRRSNEARMRMQSISGELGADIKECVENKHLHAGALKAVAKLVRMEPEKRDDFLRAYRLYFDYAEEARLFGAAHVGDFIDEAEASANRQAEPNGVAADNVSKFKRGTKRTSDNDPEPPLAA